MLPSAKELSYFNQVAITLNFSHAAKQLNMSQPSLSMAIKRLEEKLNAELFHRQKTGLVLTHQGKSLFRQVKSLMEQWQQIHLNIRGEIPTLAGRVTVGCHAVLSPYMANLVALLNEKYPELEFNMHHDLSPAIIKSVLDGHVDIGFALNPPDDWRLITHSLSQSEMSFWAREGSPWEKSPEEQAPPIIFDKTNPVSLAVFERFKINGYKHGKIININNYESICTLTMEGCGIGILPNCYVQKNFTDKLIRLFSLPFLKYNMNMLYRSQDKDSKIIQTVIEEIRIFAKKVLNQDIPAYK